MCRFSSTTIALASFFCMASLTWAADQKPPVPPTPPPADVDLDLIVVSAPPVGAPHERIASGARAADSPRPLLFASSSTGGTIAEKPTFYWYLTKSTDCDVEMDLVRMDAGGRTSVFKKVWEGVKDPGVYSFEASETDGKPLQLNVEYQVTVTVMLSKTQNADSSGFVTRVAPPSGITSDSVTADFAKAGLWYDAIAAISKKIDSEPTNETARKQRRGLLWTEHVFSQVNGPSDSTVSQTGEADRLRDFAKNESKSPGK